MNPVNWLRVGIYVAVIAAVVGGVAAVRAHWINVGEERVQAKWDQQIQADKDRAMQLHVQAARDQAADYRNAERIAHEDHLREQARAERLAAARAAAAGLRDAIAKLDSDDLSAAEADPRVAAVARRAVAARGLLARCGDRYTQLGKRAAELRDQVAGLQAFALNVCRAGAQQGEPQ